MNPPTVGGKFAAKDVGGGVPDAPGGVKTPPYDAVITALRRLE